jgi:hypothetical protein
MSRSLFIAVAVTVITIGASTGCAHNQQLQYDLGRAHSATFAAQANLDRPSVANAAYGITGVEALELRSRVTETTTDEESGEAEAVESVKVK